MRPNPTDDARATGAAPERSRSGGRVDHTAPLGDTGWRVWRTALLRAAGFPAAGLERLRAVDAARAADALLGSADAADQSSADQTRFDQAYEAAVDRLAQAVWEIAGDPLFREALTWQNPSLIGTALDPLRAYGPTGRRNASRRQKETVITQYWSRYCGKNDTIGFFGPVCWITVGDDVKGIESRPGKALLRSRHVFLERWTLVAFADHLAADPTVRRQLPVRVVPTITLRTDGRTLRHPSRGDLALTKAEASVIVHCDGTGAAALARAVVADPESGLRREDDVYLTLASLADRELVQWGIDIPMNLSGETALLNAIQAIEDQAIRERVGADYDRLMTARDAVVAATGDADALNRAMSELAETFTSLTGHEAHHSDGKMYAGRTVCWEDTVRDLEVSVGQNVLDALAGPLELLFVAARWLSNAIADAYLAEFRAIYDELAEERGSVEVPYTELSFLAQGLFFGAGERPVDAVTDDFTRRWADLLGLDDDVREVRYRSSDLRGPVSEVFAAERPAWKAARFHSPDLHIIGTDEQIRSGEFTAVIGELHAAWNALESICFCQRHPDYQSLLDNMAKDLPGGRILPLMPESWPRLTSRTSAGLEGPDDLHLAFVKAPGGDLARLLPSTSLTVFPADDGGLLVRSEDGRHWPLVELFGSLLATHAVDAFKLLGAFRHSPRVWIDNVVVARETWRTSVADLEFATVKDERDRYLAVRRWRAALGLPDRVFVRVATEIKPIYVDLTSPLHIRVLTMMIRSGLRNGGPDTAVTISEMAPTPEEAWVPDADGNVYASELRLLAVDPRAHDWAGAEAAG